MEGWKRHKNLLLTALLFVACGLVFVVFWKLDVTSARQKSLSMYLNDILEEKTISATGGATIEQTFLCDKPLYALGLNSSTQGEPPASGTLHLQVYDEAGQLLGQAEGRSEETVFLSYFVFVFPEVVQSENGVYRLVFWAEMQDENAVFTLTKSRSTPDGWQLVENGAISENEALSILVSVDPIGGFLTVFYWVFALLASAAIAGIFWLSQREKLSLHKLYAIAAAILGLLYCFLLPPYSVPDEQFHINQTFNISSQWLGEAPGDIPWGTNYKRASDHNARIEDQNTTVFTYREIARNFFALAENGTSAAYEGEEVGGYRLIYWPAALAVTLARLLRLGFVPALFLGRLANLGLFIWLTALAVKKTPCGKSIFAAVGLLPMTLHLAASFSRDALTIALYVCFSALCLHYILDDVTLGCKDILLLLALAVLAAPSKGVYTPLLLLCLLIPKDRYHWRGKGLSKGVATALPWGIFACGIISFLVQGGYETILEKMGLAESPGHANAMLAVLPLLAAGLMMRQMPVAGLLPWASAVPAGVNPDSITYSFIDIFTQPVTMIWLLSRTFAENSTFYLSSMLGGSLSYYTLTLDWGFTIVLVVLLCAACLPDPGDKHLNKKPLGISAGLVVAVCALVVLGCIVWTPQHYDTIYGIQGRYFLPVLPLALCLISRPFGGIAKSRPLGKPLVFCFSAVSVFALLNAFLLILER